MWSLFVGKTLEASNRQEGDGMESKLDKRIKSDNLIQTNAMILPPIVADKDTLIRMRQPEMMMLSSSVATHKEPKFVPYEPYKGAVRPIMPPTKRRKNRTRSRKYVEEKTIIRLMDDAEKDNQLKILSEELKESEKQLEIQIQVNREVKKLLVASVGEDIEAKVDFLTQDKARLASEMRNFTQKISQDFEMKEQLSVESELWKSKFLACSVIVDELARWKVSLLQRVQETDHYVRLLMREREILWKTMLDNLKLLFRLQMAFDPLFVATSNKHSNIVESISLLGLSDLTLATSVSLQERLMGSSSSRLTTLSPVKSQLPTPAEEGLLRILNKKIEAPSGEDDYSSQASILVKGAARPHLAKINEKLSLAKNPSPIKCCSHCNGKVHVV